MFELRKWSNMMTSTFEIMIPPGTYYMGDPCYAVRDVDWHTLLHSADYFHNPVGEIHGFRVYATSTAYGDGEYIGSSGHSYPVDAGLIGLVPVEYVTQFESSDIPFPLDGMRKITITVPTLFWKNNGVIGLMGVEEIDTAGTDDEFVEEYDDLEDFDDSTDDELS